MATVVRELVVKWGFQVDNRKLQALDRTLGDVKRAGLAVGAAFVASGTALFALAKSVADVADNARKTAQSVGVTTEVFQELTFAAKLGGVEQNELAASLRLLGRNALDASRGSLTTARAFKELGVEIKDSRGELKPTEVLLLEIADRFEKLPDGPRKTGLALEVLGRSGAKLIPTLNAGSAGIVALGEEARRMGAVISDDTAAAAEEMNDAIERAQTAMFGVAATVGVELIPVIKDVALAFRDWVVENRELIKQKVQTAIELAKDAIVLTWQFTQRLSRAMGALVGFFRDNEDAARSLKNVLVIFISVLAVAKVQQFVLALGALKTIVLGINAAIAANPIGLLLTLLGIAVGLWIANWSEIREVALFVWEKIAEALVDFSVVFFDFVDDVKRGFVGLWDLIVLGADTALQTVMNAWGGIADWFRRTVTDPILAAWDRAAGIVGRVADFLGLGGGGAASPAARGNSPGRPGSPESRATPTLMPSALGGPARAGARTVTVNAPVTVSVPAGMGATEKEALVSSVRRAAREVFEQSARELLSEMA